MHFCVSFMLETAVISSKEILAKTGIKTAKTLTRWYQRGLIPRPTVGTHPSGRGKVGYWPDWVADHCRRMIELRRDGYSLEAAARQADREGLRSASPPLRDGTTGAGEVTPAARESQQDDAIAQLKVMVAFLAGNLPPALRGEIQTVAESAHKVHRALGPGLRGVVYEEALVYELVNRGVDAKRGEAFPVRYGNMEFGDALQPDIVIGNLMVAEVKSVEDLRPLHEEQTRNLLRWTDRPVGILINFNVVKMTEGLRILMQRDWLKGGLDTKSGEETRQD